MLSMAPTQLGATSVWVAKADDRFLQHIIDDVAHLPDYSSSHGFVHTELVDDRAEAVRGGELP